MEQWLNLLEETKMHFMEGARSVRAYTNERVYIITQGATPDVFWVTIEEAGFPKKKTDLLDPYFKDVFGIEARY